MKQQKEIIPKPDYTMDFCLDINNLDDCQSLIQSNIYENNQNYPSLFQSPAIPELSAEEEIRLFEWDPKPIEEQKSLTKFFVNNLKKGKTELASKTIDSHFFNPKLSDRHGYTPLHCAAIFCDSPEIIHKLVAKGANIDSLEVNNNTPLHLSVDNQNIKTTSTLLSLGANKKIKNYLGKEPLQYMSDSFRAKMTDMLTPEKKQKLLIKKSISGSLNDIKALFSNEANKVYLNLQDDEGNTPLHHSTKGGHFETSSYLLDMGANKTIKNNYGQTAKDLIPNNSHTLGLVFARQEALLSPYHR